MVKIRARQMDAFHQAVQLEFEKSLAAHVAEFSPLHAGMLGEAGMLAVVRLGVRRAEAYGFTGQGPIQLFLDLMCLLGSEFDSDWQYPWAASILTSENPGGQMERADLLHAVCLRYLDRVAGEENEFARTALQAIRAAGPGALRDGRGDFTERAAAALGRLYPQKAEYLGAERLRAVIGRGAREAQTRSITGEGGIWLMVVLDFIFGHGVTRDPLLPWVGATLSDAGIADPNERARRLYQTTMVHLDRVIAELE